jgi:hypothetical protein
MQNYSLVHVSDAALLRDLTALVAQNRLSTATLLAHIAEVDARKLYVPAGYSSMFAYCVEELHLSEDAAAKRIQAARAARRFPVLFAALAEGRLHLAGVRLLAPHLTPENVGELIELATHKSKSDIEELLIRRFHHVPGSPSVRAVTPMAPDTRARSTLRPITPPPPSPPEHAPGHAESNAGLFGSSDEHAPGHVEDEAVPPPPPERFLLQLTISKSARDKLQYAQALLSHVVPNGDAAQVFERALDALIAQQEKRKLGAITGRPVRKQTSVRPGKPSRSIAAKRYIPARVRRAVWERDRGQCTFVSSTMTRCKATRFLEFDHINPVARGGRATVEGMRLRCRAHNQYEAERVFGTEFMRQKRLEARLAAAGSRGGAG